MRDQKGRGRLRVVPAAIAGLLVVGIVVAVAALLSGGDDGPGGPPPPAIDVKRYVGHGNVADCTTFKAQADAQAVLRAEPTDRNGLDLDGDGIACPERPGPKDTVAVERLFITDKDGAPIDPNYETAKRKEREAARAREQARDKCLRVAGVPREPLRRMRSSRVFRVALVVALSVVLTFLTLPVVAIFVDTSPLELFKSLGEEGALEALRLSFFCTAIAVALIVVFGTPAAYFLATRRRFRGRSTIVTLIELPLVLPPAVAGIGLLASLGPSGILGGVVADLGLELVLTTVGVVLALTFVSAPFYLRQAQSAFEAVDTTWLDASRTLGASETRTFFAVAIPTSGPGLISGLALAWGRALGEFGATLMFAGSFRGITQTVPLAIYERFANDFTSALALSAVLVAVSAALLLSIKLLSGSAWLGATR